MTIADIHLALYALCAWGAVLNTPAWGRLLFKHLRPARTMPWHCDARFVNRIGLFMGSMGAAILEGSRVVETLRTNVGIHTPVGIGDIGITLMALSEPFFLRIDDIHAKETGHKSINWRLYWAGVFVGVSVFLAWRVMPTTGRALMAGG